jgi:site-specific DNA-methyltransferase (adenine-specific)
MNTVHNIDFLNNDLPDKCANLIIADPPYYKVKGDFDFIWKTFDDYLVDVEKWCLECKRILADNGTLFWYGGSKNIAYAQVIFDKHFNLINNLTWNKGSFMGLEKSEGLRSFAPCTERILMYDNARKNYGTRDLLKMAGESISPFARIMKKQMKKLNITGSELSELQLSKNGNKTGWISNKISGAEIPTIEQWDLICDKLNISSNYEELKTQREKEQKEYLKIQRPFNNRFNLQEVLNFSNEQAKTSAKYDHDTVKPETLTRALILTCSRENDLVVVPFAGSGTECAMSAKEKRNFIGYEITEKHAKMAQDRANKILKEPTLL